MKVLSYLTGLVRPPAAEDLRYREAPDWLVRFDPQEPMDRILGPLVLDHARRRYAEAYETFDVLDAKAGELLKTATLTATLVLAAVAGLGMPATWAVKLALVALLAAVILLVLSRRPLRRKIQPRIADVLARIAEAPHPEAWLAAGLDWAIEASEPARSFKARNLTAAAWLLAAAVFLLIVAVWLY